MAEAAHTGMVNRCWLIRFLRVWLIRNRAPRVAAQICDARKSESSHGLAYSARRRKLFGPVVPLVLAVCGARDVDAMQ